MNLNISYKPPSTPLHCKLVNLNDRNAAKRKGACDYLTTAECMELRKDVPELRSISLLLTGETELCVVLYQLLVHICEYIRSSVIV